MPVYSCPKGHSSSESDFCSECGAKIQGASSVAQPVATAGFSAPCPDCAAPRADTSSNFCEVCGYNFATGTHGNVPAQEAEVPVVAAPVATSVEAPPVEAPPVAAQVTQWTVIIAIDPTLAEPGGPEPPANVPPVTVNLDKPANLIGRRSEKRAIIPEVSLDLDDAVSHRHALLTRCDDGSLTLRDIGSANGTRLNGTDVKPLSDVAVHDGDQVTLGRWTRLTVRSV